MRGNCYVASEALFHLLDGSSMGYKPMNMKREGESHWFLEDRNGQIIDPVSQFKTRPHYRLARGRGFLTKKPSKRAAALMKRIVYQCESGEPA